MLTRCKKRSTAVAEKADRIAFSGITAVYADRWFSRRGNFKSDNFGGWGVSGDRVSVRGRKL